MTEVEKSKSIYLDLAKAPSDSDRMFDRVRYQRLSGKVGQRPVVVVEFFISHRSDPDWVWSCPTMEAAFARRDFWNLSMLSDGSEADVFVQKKTSVYVDGVLTGEPTFAECLGSLVPNRFMFPYPYRVDGYSEVPVC